MKIGDIDIGRKVLIVAEIGNNHEGDAGVAKELVRKAADCGVDAVKFQTFRTEEFIRPDNVARFEQLKSYELGGETFAELSELAHSLGLLFISTPFDIASVDVLMDMVDAYKVASGDNQFYPLLKKIAQADKPIIVSTGLGDLEQAKLAIDYMRRESGGALLDRLAVLHCVSAYPVPPEQANLKAISTLGEALGCAVGYSDHVVGIDACLASVALGARVVEKHFTLDKNYSEFRDHKLSADPGEMRMLVERTRLLESMLCDGRKVPQPCELNSAVAMRRSIAARMDMKKGHAIAYEDLRWLRPGDGMAPGNERQLLGRVLRRDVAAGEKLMPGDVE